MDFQPFDKQIESPSSYKERISRVGIAFMAMTVVTQLAAIVLYQIVGNLAPQLLNNGWIDWVITMLCLYGIASIPTYFILKTVPASVPEKQTITPATFLIFLLIGFFFVIVGSFAGQGVNSIIDMLTGTTQGSEITDAIQGSTLWLTCLYTVVIAPVMEELFFRKLLLDRLAPTGGWCAILISGIFFGLFHGNIDQFFYAALLGCLFAYIYLNTGNVLYPILLHAIVNFFGGILPTLFTESIPDFYTVVGSGNEEATRELFANYPVQMIGYLITGYLPYLFAIVGVILLACYGKRLLRFITPCAIPKGERATTVLWNGGVLSYVLVSLALMLLTILSNILEQTL